MRSTLRTLLVLALTLSLALFVAACGGDDNEGGKSGDGGETASKIKEGGEATFNYPSFPDYLDPALSYTAAGWQALYASYGQLTTYARKEGKEGAKLIPGLAEALPEISEDGKTYTFKLRDGLKYSDGSPVKANDFEHAIKRVITLESGGASFYTGTIKGAEEYLKAGKAKGDISGITADDETGEIKIEHNSANGQFPYILSMPFASLVPGDTPFEVLTKNPPPGVAPMKITSVEGSRKFVLEKNENWPDIEGIPAAHLDKITVNVVDNNERGIRDVLTNKADWMDDPGPGDALREFKEKAPERYTDQVTNSTYYFFLNHRVKPSTTWRSARPSAWRSTRRPSSASSAVSSRPAATSCPRAWRATRRSTRARMARAATWLRRRRSSRTRVWPARRSPSGATRRSRPRPSPSTWLTC